jgi:hypothetical protein
MITIFLLVSIYVFLSILFFFLIVLRYASFLSWAKREKDISYLLSDVSNIIARDNVFSISHYYIDDLFTA